MLATGSRGDVQPMLAQALALKARGHTVTLAAPPKLDTWLATDGLEVQPFGQDFQPLLAEYADAIGDRPLLMLRTLLGLLRETHALQYRQLLELVPGQDAVIGGGALVAGHLVCEALQVPFGFVAYAPTLLPSAHHAPLTLPFSLPFRSGFDRHANRLLWGLNAALWNQALLKSSNALRAKHGLRPLRSFWDAIYDPRTRLVLATDPALSPLPPDLRHVFQPGFLYHHPDEPLPESLEALLGDGRSTVYAGFGSMGDPDPAATTELLDEAARLAGVRLLISAGWAGLGQIAGEHVSRIGSVPHHRLFPRLAGVIHHGGAGTSSAAAWAGVPQLVVPHLMDQYYWGERVLQTGLGPAPLPRGRLSARGLAAGIRALIETPAYRHAAAGMGEALRASDGTGRFCDWIEAGMPVTAAP